MDDDRRRARILLRLGCATLVTCALLATGCAGSNEPRALTPASEAAAESMLRSASQITGAVAGLALCDTDAGCDQARPATVARTARAAATRFEVALRHADDGCLRAAGSRYLRAFRAYAAYADAVRLGGERQALAAVRRGDRLMGGGIDKLASCGFVEPERNLGLQYALEARRVNATSVGLQTCKTRACLEQNGMEMQVAATEAVTKLERLVTQASGCVRDVMKTGVRVLATYRRLGAAARHADGTAMRRSVRQIVALQQQLAQRAALCPRASVDGR